MINQKRVNRLIDISRSLQPLNQTGSNYHVSFILDKNRTVVVGINNYNKLHLGYKFGEYKDYKYRGGYIAKAHSETIAMRNYINKCGNNDCSGLTLVNIRLSKEGIPMMSKPCANCQQLIVDAHGFKTVYWTNGNENEIETY